MTAILSHLRRLRDGGDSELMPPLPAADSGPGGLIGDWYSDQRLVELAAELYEQAISAYTQLVERWFSTLAAQLEHSVLLPARVVGFINPGDPATYGRIPSLAGYLEPLPPDQRTQMDMKISQDHFDFSVARRVWRDQQTARPHAARWLTGTVGGMSFEVGHRTPVADVVYSWLARDLERLGLVKRMAGHPSGDGVTTWDAA